MSRVEDTIRMIGFICCVVALAGPGKIMIETALAQGASPKVWFLIGTGIAGWLIAGGVLAADKARGR